MWSARGLVLLLAFALGCVRAQVVINTHPMNQMNVVPGTDVMFTVVATGNNLTYQWQRDGVNLTDGARYSGTTTTTLTVMNVTEEDEGNFTCVVTDDMDSITSNAAELTVLADCNALPDPANGQVTHTAGTTEGQTATYNCDTGYNLVGVSTRTCQANGEWSGSASTCQAVDCNALSDPANGQVSHTAGTTFGQTATYSCNTGYNLVGDSTRMCQAIGDWSGSAPTCRVVDCRALTNPANGQVSTTGTTFGQNATYSCNTGYNLVGDSTRTCEATGNWSGSAPTCELVDCNALTNPANGQVDDSAGTTFGQNATYSCITGYNLVGDNTRTCEATGNWSGSAPTCEPVDCSALTNPANGQVSHTAGTTFEQTATYSCNTGYNLVGDSTRTCQATGNWSGSAPTCQIVDCSALTNPANGQVSHTAGTTFEQTAIYSCNTGYNLVGDNTRTCEATGNWSGSAPTCQIVDCSALPNPTNGQVSHTAGTTFEQTATYSCNTGYNLVGENTRTCQADGMWSGSEPTCQIVDCSALPNPTNGQVSHTAGTTFGETATYSCNTGYNLVGDNTRTCEAAGEWSGSAPTCQLEPPQITQQPTNQTDIDPGSTVTFTVNATTGDAEPLTYQWQLDDSNLVSSSEVSGITTDTLTIANVQESNEGMYGCVVTNAAGNTTSNPAQLTVLDPPRITIQPDNRLNVIPGSNVMFTVSASGLRLNYTWLQNGSALPSDSRFVTANEMLTIRNVMPSDVGTYSCVVSNAAGNDTSDPARLTLIGPPDITVPPENVAVENGSNAEFNCTATGLGTLTFMWTTNAPVGSLPPSVESNDTAAMTTTSTLSLTGVDTSYRGDYTCTVSNERGRDTAQATLSVIVIDNIQDQTVTTGLNVTFNCSAEGSPAISYQWRRTELGSLLERGFEDVDRVLGQTTATLTILNVGVDDEGEYTCFVNVSGTLVGTRTANLTTQGPNITDLTFTPDPVTEGENLMLECVAQNNLDAPNNLMFYWYHNESRISDEDSRRMITPLSEDSATRVASSMLVVTNVTRRDGGLYRCSVFNRNITDSDTATTSVTVYFAPELTFRTEQGVATGRVRRNVSTSLSLSCRVNAVPAATFVEIRRRNATDEIVLNRTDLDDSNMQFVQYTLSNLMLSDSFDVFSCVANNSVGLREVNFTLVVQAPPGQVGNATVRSENLNLRNTRLTWDAPENNNARITTYWVTSCISFTDSTNDTCIGQTTIAVKDPAVPTISLTDIKPQRRYRVTIRAENAAGMGPESQPYFFDSATDDDGRPRNLEGPFVSERGVVLSWQLPPLASNQTDADVIVDTYIINYNRIGNEATMTTSRDPTIAIGGLDPGQMYRFRVSANYSLPVLLSTEETLNLTTTRYVPVMNPAVPITTSDSITVSWPAPSASQLVENYILEYTLGQITARRKRQAESFNVTVTAPTTSYTLRNNIRPFTRYTFRVFSDFGNGLVSLTVDTFTAETEEARPDRPQNLEVVSVFHVFLGLRWDPPLNPNGVITSYRVQYMSPGGSPQTRTVSVQDYEQQNRNYQLDSLSYGTMFNIRVAAINSAGEGEMTDAITNRTTVGVFAPQISSSGSQGGNMYRLDINQFDRTYGPLSHYKIVVVPGGTSDRDTRTAVPDGMLSPYDNDNQMTFYAAASINVDQFQSTFIIGDGQTYTRNNVEFMNSPLRGNQQYVFFVRLYSSNPSVGFNDSRVTQVFIVDCSTLTNPANGQVSHTAGTTFGQNATYSCNTGYNLVGDNTRTCQANGMWSGSVPTCQTPQPAVDPVVIIAPIAAVALLLLIIFLILIFIAIFTRKSSGVKRHRLDDGLVDGKKKKAHAVELRRTRLFSPVLNVATPDVFTSAGQPTTLICEASGTPAPDVSWTCNDKPVDKERFIQLADSSLFIQDTDLQDEGSYLVVATNSAGTTEQMVRVTVVRPVPPELDVMHKPIPVGDFTERIALLRANDDEGLEDEYADLDLDWNFTSYAAKLNINKNKNRYVNIIPYDHARVVLTLQDNTPGSDYINASYIDGYNQPNAYVATQGPIPSTFPDFWRMVWELDCPTIVMVTNLKEDDKVKCNQYWPSYGTTTYGSLQVTLKEVENLAEYSIRTFNVSPLAGQSKVQMPVREVRQFHFLVWPDHGVPQYATALLSFRKRVVRYHSEKRGPMVVHCSAGVGRTGTFITIDAMLKQLEAENIVDIFNFARHMRFRRNYMVQTSPQYVFLHDALLEAIMCGDTSIPAPELRTKLQSLVEVDPDTNKTRIDTQFETLVTASPPDEDFDTTIAELPDNKPKNRFNRHLPSNALRVTLSTDNDQSDYICASFVDGYRQRVAFIVTQAPMENTIGDFWRMIWEQKSAAIVMLTELEEGGKEMCVKYWPVEVGQPEVFGAYQVELSDDEREVGDYITRKFKLSPIDKPQESRIITQLHYIHWPRSSAPSNTRSIIDLIDQLQRVQRKSGNGPITVHCDDGLGRTGAFCTLYTVLERVKAEQVVDVFQAVKTIRIQRAGMLESLPQYEFVHKAVLEFLDSFSDYQNFK